LHSSAIKCALTVDVMEHGKNFFQHWERFKLSEFYPPAPCQFLDQELIS